jgi:hypothetical protein
VLVLSDHPSRGETHGVSGTGHAHQSNLQVPDGGRAPSAEAKDARQRRTGGRGREMRVLHGELVAWAPRYIAHTDDKKRGRLNIISHLLSRVPYKPLARQDSTLPHPDRGGPAWRGDAMSPAVARACDSGGEGPAAM